MYIMKRKYRVVHQQSNGNRVMYLTRKRGLQWVVKINGDNRWYYPVLNKWGDIDSYNSLSDNVYEINAGSLRSVVRHILKPCKSGDIYKIHGKYLKTDINIIIK